MTKYSIVASMQMHYFVVSLDIDVCTAYMSIGELGMQNRYFAYFSDFSHIDVDFRILICEFAYAWRPCY